MATETWWHGQKHCAARMGEASEAARWDECGGQMAKGIGSSKSRDQENMRSSTLRSGQPWLRSHSRERLSGFQFLHLLWLMILLIITPSTAVFVDFSNCLSPDIINSNSPKQLQFVPLYVWATINSSAASHDVNVTVYGNVAGIATQQSYPAPDDPQWKNPNDTLGKIPDVAGPASDEKYTTFTTQFNVLDYTPYDPPPVRFCNSSSLTQCPLTPVFNFTGNE